MANTSSAQKAARQTLRRTEVNKSRRSEMRTYVRKVEEAIASKDPKVAAEWDAGCVWLGVNQKNERAQQFYQRYGFTVNGTRSFRLGAHIESDYVMVRPLDAA